LSENRFQKAVFPFLEVTLSFDLEHHILLNYLNAASLALDQATVWLPQWQQISQQQGISLAEAIIQSGLLSG